MVTMFINSAQPKDTVIKEQDCIQLKENQIICIFDANQSIKNIENRLN